MSRFIDADKLEQFLHPDEWGTPDECWRPESEFGKIVRYIPTADVRENVHGIWREVCNVGETSNWECSVCGGVITGVPNDDDHPLYAFCPCCGADMRGDKNV